MASSSAATPDTPITLKVNFDGVTRRFKLPLRELGAASLEDKVSRNKAHTLAFAHFPEFYLGHVRRSTSPCFIDAILLK